MLMNALTFIDVIGAMIYLVAYAIATVICRSKDADLYLIYLLITIAAVFHAVAVIIRWRRSVRNGGAG